MCAAINSDDERYANESFESASENEILEMSNLESETSDSDEDVVTVNEFKRYSNRTVKSNQKREHQPLNVQKKYVKNETFSSTSNSPVTSEDDDDDDGDDDDDDDDDDEDDNDTVIKQHNIADIKTLTMSFDTDVESSHRSAAITPIRRSLRQNRENDYKQPLQDVLEQNENSEYYTEDEDYQNIQKMERVYKTNLLKNQQLSGKKSQINSANKKIYEESTSEESEEVEEESEFDDEYDNDLEIAEESLKEESDNEQQQQQQQPSLNQPKIALNLEQVKSNMTTNENDIILTSKMLQPVESLAIDFNQLKLPNSEEIAMSLIKAVKSSIIMQSNSLQSIDKKQENKSSPSKEESQNEEDNMEKQEKEVNHTKITDKEIKNELHDVEEESRFDEKRLAVYQPNNIQSMVQRFYDEPITYSLSTRSACPNRFKSDDCLFQKSHFKSLQRIPTHDTHKLKPHPRKSWSFTNERMREIERHNQILLRKILSQKPTQKFQPPKMLSRERSMQHCAARVTSSSLNRKKQQRQINLDNHVLQRKIEAISLRRPVLP